jgi:hypothetical protein
MIKMPTYCARFFWSLCFVRFAVWKAGGGDIRTSTVAPSETVFFPQARIRRRNPRPRSILYGLPVPHLGESEGPIL